MVLSAGTGLLLALRLYKVPFGFIKLNIWPSTAAAAISIEPVAFAVTDPPPMKYT